MGHHEMKRVLTILANMVKCVDMTVIDI
jgi:hypothetical protein